ncbi:S8 family serine peptidase [Carboxylicivirga mesophila]|uniref:S8 family serine peptidase n=1 Tax=Carboxylicivirga mesophila TaxID=1166478 RepID=A0ABS5K6Y7_9BACT|nr:S8 family serine peptidase [Carboxylicivirga mesophila]MBS2210759.1 S8 family serine peptidase [Carboxylicivirga mesophila]
MKNYKLIYLLLIVLMLVPKSLLGQTSDINIENIEKGRIRIKLKKEQLISVNSSLKSATSALKGGVTGITSLDNISNQVGITQIRRVFPFSLKNEMKHREHGLHLWIELAFDESVDPLTVVDQYKGLEEIEIVKPVYRKIRIDSDKKAIPYMIEVVSKASKRANTSASVSSSYTPFFDDPLLPKQWHYESDGSIVEDGYDIDLFEAWQQTSGNSDIIVAIVDQGVDVYHEDLQANIWRNEAEINGEEGVDNDQNGYINDYYGYNFRMDASDIVPGDHGTHVAGTVGAVSNNGIGVAGVAGGDGSGNGVKLMSCQVFDERASGGANFAQAIVYGADNGAVISQNSWGYNGEGYYEPEVHDAIRYFVAEAGQYDGSPMKGGIVVFAAGNEGVETLRYPAAFEETIAVTSLGPNGVAAAYSNYGDWASIGAPGGYQPDFGEEGGVLSTIVDNKYGYMDGTSMACPHVSGVAALAIAKFGGEEFTAEELKTILLNSTKRFIFQHNNKYGTGALNAASALADDNRIPPNAITDLRASDIFHNEIRIEWTVPVDEDNGEPRYYYLCIGASEITEQNFDNHSIFLLENELKAGETFNIDISGFQKLTDYWFAIKSADQFDNISDISNILKVKTSNLPHFMESTRSVDVAVDVSQESVKKVQIDLSNIGDGIVYYSSTVRNEKYYWKPEAQILSTLASSIDAKVQTAELNPELYETTRPYSKDLPSLKAGVSGQTDLTHWKDDNTEWVAGLSYQNSNPPASLVGSGNSNAGLIAATRFDIPYDYSLNVTHLEVALWPEVKDKPIVIELRKGSKDVKGSERIYMQEYYPDTTNVLKYYRIPIYQPQRFEDGEIFWVVLHFPKEMEYPLPVQFGSMEYGYFVFSKDNGVSFQDGLYYLRRPIIPMLSVLSTGDDGSYVFLSPGSGEIPQGTTVSADVIIDATHLTEGKHLASLGIITNDIHKPMVNIEVKVDVTGQLPKIDTDKIHQFKAYVNEENRLIFDLHNEGLADLKVYDVISTTAGITKAFEDTVIITPDFDSSVPFSYTPGSTGVIKTGVKLVTNVGEINLPCEFSVVEAPVLSISADNSVDVVYGETATLVLQLSNDGLSTALEYDLSHYDPLKLSKGLLANKLDYQILTSTDVNGPEDNAWDDIIGFAKLYNNEQVAFKKFNLGFRFPFYTERMEDVYMNARGELFFYRDGIFSNDPDAEFYGHAKGWLLPIKIEDHYLVAEQVYHHTFGDRSVYTVNAIIRKPGDTPDENHGEISYQVVLYRNGTIDFRYQNVSDLDAEWRYKIGVQGLTGEDLLIYKEYDDTGNVVYDGKVIRFEPVTGLSMIVSTSSAHGVISAGDARSVEVTIDPEAMSLVAGSYSDNVLVQTNTANKAEYWPFTINVTGTPEVVTKDTIDFETVKLEMEKHAFILVENIGSSDVSVDNVTFDHAVFTSNSTFPISINGLANHPLNVTYNPDAVGEIESKAHISLSDGTQKTVVITGNGVEDPSYDITISEEVVVNINAGDVTTLPISLKNHDKGVPLDYTFKGNWLSYIDGMEPKRGEGDNNLGSSYGYWWHISDENTPYHKWEDISNDSEMLLIEQDKQQEIELPFEFPFFGEYYNVIWVSKNGYVTVVEPEVDYFDFEFHKDDGLSGMIAPFWSPLLPDEGKGVMLKMEDSRVLLQWDEFTPEEGGNGILTFQLEIMKDGTIHFHYKSVDPFTGGLQYGLESPDEEETVETTRSWILRWSKLSNECSITFVPPLKGTLESNEQADLTLALTAERVYRSGVYRDTVELYTNSSKQALHKIPVQLTVSGQPELDIPTSMDWGETVFRPGLALTRKIKLVNTGYDVLNIDKVVHQQLDNLILYDENGVKIVKSSSGELFSDIVIAPWDQYIVNVEIPVNEFNDVNGSISWEGDFESLVTPVTATIVESPVFAWNATNQSYRLNNKETAEYQFTVTNHGETTLHYDFAPAVAPSGGETEFPVVIDGESNYTLEYPITVDSLILEKKEKADGSLIPLIEGNNKGFSNRFTAPEGGFFLTHVKAFTSLLNLNEYVRVEISMGGELPQDGEQLYEEFFVVDQIVDEGWVFFPLSQPITIPEGEKFFVTVYQTKSHKYMGFENTNDENLKSNSFSGNHNEGDDYYWWAHYEDMVWKIRPLTAAGEDSWIELDNYCGELQANESVQVNATILASKAGHGEHTGKIIALCNDVDNSKSEFNVSLSVNGAPEFKYYPNIYKDTLSVVETEELLLNYLYVDPEGETMSFDLENAYQGPQVKYKVTGNTTVSVEIKTGYDDEGTYSYPVQVTDASGSIANDTIVIKVANKNRAPIFNEDYAVITLNLADPRAVAIDPSDVFTDPDGDDIEFLAGNYTPDIVDMSFGSVYINLNPLSAGTGMLVFAADDGKEDGFVIYAVYVQVIDDPDALDTSPDGIWKDNPNETFQFSIYPNPVTNGQCQLAISTKEDTNAVVELFNAVGQKLKIIQMDNLLAGKHLKSVSLNGLSSGIYNWRLIIDGEQVGVKKLIIR